MHYKLFILALVSSYTFGQGGFYKRPKPELIEKKPPLMNEINVDSISLKITDDLNLGLKNEIDSLTINNKKEENIVDKGFHKTEVVLNINTIPERVEVSIDGKLIGKTPILGKKIISGFHTFEINKEGFAPISYELNVNPSKSVNLDFFMNPVYDIKFKTDEAGLIFELNDEHRWTEDAIKMKLEAGDHKLRVYRLGDIIDEQTIVADQPLTFQYYLKRGVIIQP
jgi:hypothetical protein